MLCIRDIMTANVVSVSPELSLRDTMELFATRHISGGPVVDGGRIVGVISTTDLLGFAAAIPAVSIDASDDEDEAAGEDDWVPDAPEWRNGNEPSAAYFAKWWDESEAADVGERLRDPSGSRNVLEEHTVAEAMTPLVYSLPPWCPIVAAAKFMRTTDVHRVLVMEGGALLGIVTTTDMVRAVAEDGVVAS